MSVREHIIASRTHSHTPVAQPVNAEAEFLHIEKGDAFVFSDLTLHGMTPG